VYPETDCGDRLGERKLLDDLAAVIAENDADFGRIRDLFQTRPELRK